MLLTAIITSALINLLLVWLISRSYQAQLDLYQEAWQRQKQTIFFQFQRIEELEIEREELHEVAVMALSVPDIEDYHEVSGLEFTVWRN